MSPTIRAATECDAAAATAVAREAKSHWGYEAELLSRWEPQLRLAASYITAHDVFVAEDEGVMVGVCALDAPIPSDPQRKLPVFEFVGLLVREP